MRGRMPTSKRRRSKRIRLDPRDPERAKNFLGASVRAAELDRVLEEVMVEQERSRRVLEANERFRSSGIQIRDVFDCVAP
jgi:hypothetical protein